MRNLYLVLICALIAWCIPSSDWIYASSKPTSFSNSIDLQKFIQEAMMKQETSLKVQFTGKRSDVQSYKLNTILDKATLATDDYTHYNLRSYATKATIPSKGPITLQFTLTYRENSSQREFVQNTAKQVVADLITDDMNTHEKVKMLHDWIVLNFSYDSKLFYRSAYDGLKTGKTVCEGYALMFYRLLTEAGIPVKVVEGYGRSRPHAWNLVQIDDQWFHVDTTWDDPVPDQPDDVSYDYYLLSDQEIKKTHRMTTKIKYPVAKDLYINTLETSINEDLMRTSFYENLKDEMGLQYLENENTIKNAKELEAMIKVLPESSTHQFTIRYVNGGTVSGDVKSVLRKLNRAAAYEYTPFNRGTGARDVLLTMTLQASDAEIGP